MEGTKTLRDFVAEVERREQAKADYIVPTSKLRMEEDTVLALDDRTQGTYSRFPIVENHVHGQIASRLSIPKAFYDDLPNRAPGLRSEVVNRLFSAQPERRMVRTLDGGARAFLSDRFKPFDNILALQGALPVLQDFPELEVKASDLSNKRMYLQVSFPKLRAEVRVGDPIQYGLTITNSEVGLGTVNVETWLLRLVCSNGAVGQSILSKRHTGSRIDADDNNFEVYQSDTLLAEMNSLRLRLRDLVRAALTEKAFLQEIDRMKALAGIEVTKPETVIENITQRFSLGEQLKSILSDSYFTAKDYTAFGIMNAVTALTHQESVKPDLDRQYDLEKIGGEIIRLSPKDWEVLSEKAA